MGYEYVNIDDCWAELKRDSNGRLVLSRSKFPSGIKALSDCVNGKGLKLGIYSDAGYYTCQKQPGSLGHEEVDADTFAAWVMGISSPQDKLLLVQALKKRGSMRTLARYLNGLLIGAMVMMGVILTVIVVFLWVYFLCKKGVSKEYIKYTVRTGTQEDRRNSGRGC